MFPIKIGVSACYWEGDPSKAIFNGRPLLFLEKSMSDYLLRNGCLVVMVPFPHADGIASLDFAKELDGLVLQGGVDVSPTCYGEAAIKDDWQGDRKRDLYEIDLVKSFFQENKPIFGICRGMQLLNVCFGGSLFQDINYFKPGAFIHRDAAAYENNTHLIDITIGSKLSALYGGIDHATVNSVHHQAVKDLAKGFKVEAVSRDDDIIEAIRMEQESPDDPYCFGVQWHPEFQSGFPEGFLNPNTLLKDFIDAVRHRHKKGTHD